MSYMTAFQLDVRNVQSEKRFQKLNQEMKDRDLIKYVFDEGNFIPQDKEAFFDSWEEQSWYSARDVITIISEKFPEMTFELTGTGENGKDFWREYFHDGDSEFCVGSVTYEAPRKIKWSSLIAF